MRSRTCGSVLGEHVVQVHLDQLDRLERWRERAREIGKLARTRILDFSRQTASAFFKAGFRAVERSVQECAKGALRIASLKPRNCVRGGRHFCAAVRLWCIIVIVVISSGRLRRPFLVRPT